MAKKKKIIIVTHDLENEFNKILNITVEINILNSGQKISEKGEVNIFRKSKNSTNNNLAEIKCGENEILLFHLNGDKKVFNDIIDKNLIFDVGTHGNITKEGSDRCYYEKLLNANNDGFFNWKIFDEVWEYFWKKGNSQKGDHQKTDFLKKILDGVKPNDINDIPEINLDLYDYFNTNPYDKILDQQIASGEISEKGKTQRDIIKNLRDALQIN